MTTATKSPTKSAAKGSSKIFDPAADAAAKQRAKARKKAAAGTGQGQLSAASRNVGFMKQQLQKEYFERQVREMLAADAALHDPDIQELRRNIREVVAQLSEVADLRREVSIRRRLAHLREQVREIDATLLVFARRSNLQHKITDEIRSVKCTNGYLGHIVRDALFGAWRRHQAQNAPLREGDAA